MQVHGYELVTVRTREVVAKLFDQPVDKQLAHRRHHAVAHLHSGEFVKGCVRGP